MLSPRDDVACGTFSKKKKKKKRETRVSGSATSNMHILLVLLYALAHRGGRACAETFARTRVPLVVDQS